MIIAEHAKKLSDRNSMPYKRVDRELIEAENAINQAVSVGNLSAIINLVHENTKRYLVALGYSVESIKVGYLASGAPVFSTKISW